MVAYNGTKGVYMVSSTQLAKSIYYKSFCWGLTITKTVLSVYKPPAKLLDYFFPWRSNTSDINLSNWQRIQFYRVKISWIFHPIVRCLKPSDQTFSMPTGTMTLEHCERIVCRTEPDDILVVVHAILPILYMVSFKLILCLVCTIQSTVTNA